MQKLVITYSCANTIVSKGSPVHRPYSRQVTERMEYNVIHPPPSVYPTAGNGTLQDQWAIKYHCQNESYNRIHRARFGPLKLWHIRKHPTRMQVAQITVYLCFCNLHLFLFLRHSLHWIKLPVNYGVASNIGPPCLATRVISLILETTSLSWHHNGSFGPLLTYLALISMDKVFHPL